MPRQSAIHAGQRYGRWTILQKMPSVKYETLGVTVAQWLCRCECGKEKIVSAGGLSSGKSHSCGCLRTEMIVKRSRTHGEASGLHGITPEYRAWVKMISRCYNPSDVRFSQYGGRGIAVCKRWRHSYERFLKDMGRKPAAELSLDRIDTNAGYEPGNCRWATQMEQQNNRRNNRWLTIDGKTNTLAEWCRISGVGRATILSRLKRGKSSKEAVMTPAGGSR